MMDRLHRIALIVSLSACVFVLNAWLPAQVVGHANQHSHHSAATHVDPLCTLVCSAGHVIHGIVVVLPSDFAPAYIFEIIAASQISASISDHHLSRGPPSFQLMINT